MWQNDERFEIQKAQLLKTSLPPRPAGEDEEAR